MPKSPTVDVGEQNRAVHLVVHDANGCTGQDHLSRGREAQVAPANDTPPWEGAEGWCLGVFRDNLW